MNRYTVRQVARMSGVSVRALHHYDQIGLLRPASVGENGYRYYGREELLRLQQILFHRELEFPLEAIRAVLAAPDFDRLEALRRHRTRLAAEARRYRRLLRTLDETLAALEGDATMDDKTLYQGFAPEKQADHEAWLVDRYGDRAQAEIDHGKTVMKGWKAEDFAGFAAEVEAIEAALADAMADGLPPDSAAVIAIVRRHHAWVARSWKAPPTRDAYLGLGQMYGDHPDFRSRYEDRAAGLLEYLQAAMTAFADAHL
ncbi:MAG TPA: MerR family transcriptional regulator [Caulobacter sp.]|nr:MerR family transcriptional regulator [Caulobacter sp.]